MTPTTGNWLLVTDMQWEHFIPGDEKDGHQLDSECHCKPALGEDAQTHAPILLHRTLPA
jgi:hypothetical protein